MVYTKRALKGTFIVLIFSLGAAVLGYVVRFLLARTLSLKDFGLFYAVFSFIALLSVVRSFGFDRSLAKFVPEYLQKKQYGSVKGSIKYVTVIQIVANIVLLVALFFCADVLANDYFKDIRAVFFLKLMAIAFLVDSFTLILKYTFQGFQRMELYAGMDIVRMIVTILSLLIGIYYGWGIMGAIFAYIAAPLVLLIVGFWILSKKVFPQFSSTEAKTSKALKRRILYYSAFMFATSLGSVIGGYADTVMLTYFKGVEDVGLYNVASPLAKVLALVPYALMGILIPLTTELWVVKKFDLLKEGYRQLIKMGAMVMIPICAAMVVFARQIIIVFFGKTFIPAVLALQILSLAMLFEMVHIICYSLFVGIGKPEITSRIIYTTTFVNVLGNFILIPKFGIIGAAIMMTASYFVMMAYGLYKSKEVLKLEFPWVAWRNILISTVLGVVTFFLIGNFIFPLSIIGFIVSFLVYGACLLILKTITIGEINMIIGLFFKRKS